MPDPETPADRPAGPKADLENASAVHKRRKGLNRLFHATRFSMAGLQRAWGEKAFRLEVGITAILLPASAFLATSFIEFALLISSLAAVLVVELLNTAIEAIVDRVGLEWNQLSMHANDLGSAAVLVSLGAAGVLWAAALLRFLLR